MNQSSPSCETPRDLRSLQRNLPNFADEMRGSDGLRIVAIGSSSTEGDGASSKEASYPAPLAAAFATRFPDRTIDVSNAGIGGQEVPDEAARFKNDVLAKGPSLVVWQLGTAANTAVGCQVRTGYFAAGRSFLLRVMKRHAFIARSRSSK